MVRLSPVGAVSCPAPTVVEVVRCQNGNRSGSTTGAQDFARSRTTLLVSFVWESLRQGPGFHHWRRWLPAMDVQERPFGQHSKNLRMYGSRRNAASERSSSSTHRSFLLAGINRASCQRIGRSLRSERRTGIRSTPTFQIGGRALGGLWSRVPPRNPPGRPSLHN